MTKLVFHLEKHLKLLEKGHPPPPPSLSHGSLWAGFSGGRTAVLRTVVSSCFPKASVETQREWMA